MTCDGVRARVWVQGAGEVTGTFADTRQEQWQGVGSWARAGAGTRAGARPGVGSDGQGQLAWQGKGIGRGRAGN